MKSIIEDHRHYMSDGSPFLPVRSKKDFVRRYAAGEFGNCSPTWNTLLEFMNSNYRGGPVHIRNRVAGGDTWYNVDPHDIRDAWRRAIECGYSPDQLYISAMAPTEKTLFQGEVMQTENGLSLYYSTLAKTMREALAERADTITGLSAVGTLKNFLCPNSYDWLQILLDRYPHHVVEFSTYSVNWGTLPRFNTCFWEVRDY